MSLVIDVAFVLAARHAPPSCALARTAPATETASITAAASTLRIRIPVTCSLVPKSLAPCSFHHPSTYANTSGATMLASLSMMNFGVVSPSLPHVIFSFGTAPE